MKIKLNGEKLSPDLNWTEYNSRNRSNFDIFNLASCDPKSWGLLEKSSVDNLEELKMELISSEKFLKQDAQHASIFKDAEDNKYICIPYTGYATLIKLYD